MQIPISGLNLIKEFEGCILSAYPDPLTGGEPITCGWGSTRKKDGSKFKIGDRLTQKEADELLVEEINKHFLPVLRKIPYWNEMDENQQGALLSFAYNLGANFYGSEGFNTITKVLKSRDWDKVPDALFLYRNPGSPVEAGLSRRRKAEGKLWSTRKAINMGANLVNFFKFFDENNPNHVSAISLLEKSMPGELLSSDAEWVIIYRANKSNGPVKLQNFFEYFNERNAHHVEAVKVLQEQLPKELLKDDGADGTRDSEWIEIYRTKPPVPSVLPVPYYNQVDNYRDAHRTCNSSSCAMCLEYLKPGTLNGPKGDDEYVKKVFATGDTTDHSVQTRVLESYGVKSRFLYNLTFDDLDKQLAKGKPIVIGILHRGTLSNPTGGHMCVVIGKKGNGYIVNDPYGSCNDGYQGPVENGRGTFYSKEMLKHRWCPAGNDGWGRIFD